MTPIECDDFREEEPTQPYPTRETMEDAVKWWRALWEQMEGE